MRYALLCVLLAGCLRADFDYTNGAIRCDGTACPPGYSCQSGLCWRGGGAPPVDASLPAADAPPVGEPDGRAGGCAGEKRCTENRPEQCDTDGNWQPLPPCPTERPQCLGGECGEGCTPGDTVCDAQQSLYVCDRQGLLQLVLHCEAACFQGKCGGVCVPKSTRCNGTVAQLCGADGQWRDDPLVQECGATCTTGTLRCNGSNREKCEGGVWHVDTACPSGCTGTECVSCAPESTAVTCGNGACGPTKNNCGETVACPTACGGTGQSCGGGGVAGKCGCTPQADATLCAGHCGTMLNNCGQAVTCDASNGGVVCASDALCGAGGAPANSCCVPEPMATTCNGRCGAVTDNCGQTVSCGVTCADPSYTCGGSVPTKCSCPSGTKHCAGNELQICDAQSGAWVDVTLCADVCTVTGCTACSLGDKSCNNNTPQTCNGSGQWVAGTTCSNQTCVAGACAGVCAPGQHRCVSNTPSSCDANGQWVAGAPCTGKTCDPVTGSCVGQCTSGAKRCGPGGNVEVCDPATLTWMTSATCTFGCGPGGGTPSCCQSDASVCTGALASPCGGKSVTKDCGATAVCNETCANGLTCQSQMCVCVPETDAAFCSRLGKNCGTLSGTDNCGKARTVTSCGGCTMPATCGGGGPANVCGCTAESDSAFCTRVGTECGMAMGADNCGGSRTVTSCGTCAPPESCGGGGTAGSCGCTPRSAGEACGAQECGVASDGCGGTVGCGSCGGTQQCGFPCQECICSTCSCP